MPIIQGGAVASGVLMIQLALLLLSGGILGFAVARGKVRTANAFWIAVLITVLMLIPEGVLMWSANETFANNVTTSGTFCLMMLIFFIPPFLFGVFACVILSGLLESSGKD